MKLSPFISVFARIAVAVLSAVSWTFAAPARALDAACSAFAIAFRADPALYAPSLIETPPASIGGVQARSFVERRLSRAKDRGPWLDFSAASASAF